LVDHFSGLHRTLLKNGRWPLAAFQKNSAKIRESRRPKETKGLKLKKE
jgi:hypothetical protein